MCLFHKWSFRNYWYPSKEARVVEFHYQEATCKKCGKTEIVGGIYDDRRERPEAYKKK